MPGVQAGVGKDEVARSMAEHLGCAIVSLADPMKRLALAVFAFSQEQLWGPSDKRNEVDERYGVVQPLPGRDITPPPSAWLSAWDRLEFVGPGWLTSLGLDDRVHMAGLRRWFVMLALESAGLDPRLVPLGHRKPTSARRVLQTLGTEWGRRQREDLWVDYMIRVAERLTTEDVAYDRAAGVFQMNVRRRAAGVIVPDVRFSNEGRAIRARGGKIVCVERPCVGLTGEAASHESERGIQADLIDGIVLNDDTLEELHRRARNLADVLDHVESTRGAA